MSKKAIISLISLSLIISILVLYRVNYVKGIRSWESNLLAILIGLAAISMLYIAYKELIKRFSRSKIDQADYAKLYDLENTNVSGQVEFYFTIEQPKEVVFTILNQNMDELEVLVSGSFKQGGHIVRYDTNKLETGIYFYCLTTPNQKTMKKIKVQHVKLTV